MNHWLLVLAMAPGTALSPTAWPAAQVETTSIVANPLDPIGWLVGGTWTTEEKSADGKTLIVRLNCRWADTRKAILFNVAFDLDGQATPQYDGMFVWHPGRQKLTLWQVNRKGEVAEGELAVDGDEVNQVVRVSHPDGSMHFLKARYQRLDGDAFRFKALFRLSETAEWLDALDVVYKRR